MIDDKKIEEAANLYRFELIASMHGSTLGTPMQCFEEVVDAETDLIENSFITGAKWAINELLKNLWHPASEAPKRRCNYLLLHYKDKEEECFEADVVDTKAWDCYIKGSLAEYINIDDLSPKKGGEQ